VARGVAAAGIAAGAAGLYGYSNYGWGGGYGYPGYVGGYGYECQ
jgi:hypothetical protein